jgi:hypothetical protein
MHDVVTSPEFTLRLFGAVLGGGAGGGGARAYAAAARGPSADIGAGAYAAAARGPSADVEEATATLLPLLLHHLPAKRLSTLFHSLITEAAKSSSCGVLRALVATAAGEGAPPLPPAAGGEGAWRTWKPAPSALSS